MEPQKKECCASGGCCCLCHHMMPILIILLGVVFLLGNLGVLSAQIVSIAWPVIIILGGIHKLTSKMCKCCK